MIYLIQILKMIYKEDKENIKLFKEIFLDFKIDAIDLGYDCFESELCSDMLFNHFGLEIENEFQLNEFTKCIMNTEKLKLGLKAFNMM